MTRLLDSLPLLYLVLLWPGRDALMGLYDLELYYPQVMYDSGIWSIRLLLLTLAVTPALLLINRIGRGKALGRWLLKRRRHFGLAAAIFAAVHLIRYLIEVGTLADIVFDVQLLKIFVAWLSVLIIFALAVTSNAWSVRRMGQNWKRLHLLVYPAAVLAFWHWYLYDYYVGRVAFWFAILISLKLLHLVLLRLRFRLFV